MSSEHCGYIIKVEHLRPHSNADRLQVLTVFGEDTCVSLDVKVGDIGIYFPYDLQLSEEYCDYNHLCRKKADGSPDTGYLERNTRHVTAIKLRGEKSSGIYMPISSLDYISSNLNLNVGDKITVLEGKEICCKYIPRSNARVSKPSAGNRTRKHRIPIAPLFAEHADTEQLAYNLGAFKPGDQIEITLKMHGTSGRTGYLPVFKGYNDSEFCQVRNWARKKFAKLFKKQEPEEIHDSEPIYDWGYVTGTRRTVLNSFTEGGYYGNNEFRLAAAKALEGKLNQGETCYYEIVGFTTAGQPIMASTDSKKVDKLMGDKSFSKQYGDTTVFSYGCESPNCDFYVYRMTMTTPEGVVIEYTPDFMRYRCEQMGVKCVPVLWKGYIPDTYNGTFENFTPGDFIKEKAEQYYDGPDPIGKTHVREGVVIRIVNRPKFCAYKHKNISFRILEGIVKELAAAPDMEEAEDLIET